MSKAITEKRDDSPQALRWQAPRETAPSLTEDTAPVLSRWVGACGLALIVLGGVSLLVNYKGYNSIITPAWGLFFTFVGLGGLMFHAANDAELQIRRAYMGFGFLWLALGVGLSLVPYPNKMGDLFLPYGLLCLVFGLVFTAAFVRNETEAKARELAEYVVGGVGLACALVGFLGGTIQASFLVPYGLLLILLGFVFLWAFISMKGIADDRWYYAALGVGLLGGIFFLIALGRSAAPSLLQKWMPGTPPYTMPTGLVLMICGALYVCLSAAYVSDRQFIVLTRRELGSLFFSPLAYFVLLGYTVVGWLIFSSFVTDPESGLWREDITGGAGSPRAMPEPIVMGYILNWFPIICLLVLVPMITMRLLSEEKRTGTLEMTLTAPVEETVVVLSKFLAALVLFLLVWAPWGLYLVSLRVMGGEPFDYRPLLGFLIALIFSGSTFVSMGLFFSSVTRNQLVAAVLSFVGMLAMTFTFFIKRQWPETSWVRTVLTHTSYVDLWFNVLQGRLATRDLVYYLSSTIMYLFLTLKVLGLRKWW